MGNPQVRHQFDGDCDRGPLRAGRGGGGGGLRDGAGMQGSAGGGQLGAEVSNNLNPIWERELRQFVWKFRPITSLGRWVVIALAMFHLVKELFQFLQVFGTFLREKRVFLRIGNLKWVFVTKYFPKWPGIGAVCCWKLTQFCVLCFLFPLKNNRPGLRRVPLIGWAFQ